MRPLPTCRPRQPTRHPRADVPIRDCAAGQVRRPGQEVACRGLGYPRFWHPAGTGAFAVCMAEPARTDTDPAQQWLGPPVTAHGSVRWVQRDLAVTTAFSSDIVCLAVEAATAARDRGSTCTCHPHACVGCSLWARGVRKGLPLLEHRVFTHPRRQLHVHLRVVQRAACSALRAACGSRTVGD